MKKLLLLLLLSSPVLAQTQKPIVNRSANGDVVVKVSPSGTPVTALTIFGADGHFNLGYGSFTGDGATQNVISGTTRFKGNLVIGTSDGDYPSVGYNLRSRPGDGQYECLFSGDRSFRLKFGQTAGVGFTFLGTGANCASSGNLLSETTLMQSTDGGAWTIGPSTVNSNAQVVYAGAGLQVAGRKWTMTSGGAQTEVAATNFAKLVQYKTEYTDLSTTARDVANTIALTDGSMAVTIEQMTGKHCQFHYASTIEAGVVHHFSDDWGATCTVTFNGTSTYTISGLGDGKTYTYACNTSNARCQISVGTTNTGLTYVTVSKYIENQ